MSRKNYAPFYGLVLSIMAMGVLYFFVSLYILTMIFVSPVVAAHSSEVVGWEVSVLLLLALAPLPLWGAPIHEASRVHW